MNDSFPRFQYSIFDRNGADAQYVVRNNDWDAFIEDCELVKQIVEDNQAKQDPIMAVTKDVNTHPCKNCGGLTEFKEGVSKAGKPWKGYFCKSQSTHVEWVR